jgi:aminoglycoside phosphotransferase (APT) family kinase protein
VDDELRRRIEERLGLEGASFVEVEEGWDSAVLEVDGEWIVRVPRGQEVRGWIRREAALLPELAAVLPVAVPRFEAIEDTSRIFFVAYRKLDGDPLESAPGASLAPQLGSFLAALHSFPREHALRAGLADVDAAGWLAQQIEFADRCKEEVMPRLDESARRQARRIFDEFLSSWDDSLETVLIHGDLGRTHILCRDSSLSGVIDWSDARLGDPALDFAWLLHGTSEPFAASLPRAYAGRRPPDPNLGERSLFYHRLGPWHEVLYGLENERPDLIESGLAGIRRRLPPTPP